MNPRDVENYLASHRKTTLVVLAIILVTAASGVFMGMRQTRNFADETRSERDRLLNERPAPVPMGDVPKAVSYGELPEANLQPNAGWENYLNTLPTLDGGGIDEHTQTKEERFLAVSTRNSRRAFSGAPPVVPHPINQSSPGSCIACHGPGTEGLLHRQSPHPTEGMDEESCQTCHGGRAQPIIAGKAPPLISHGLYANCTQCHVPSGGHGEGVTVPGFGITAQNSFAGRPEPGAGERAFDGAPPTVPHTTVMREKCMSCHGPNRVNAIRTSHPDQQSCNQCHAPSADMDQRHFGLEGITNPVNHPVNLTPPPPVLDIRDLNPAPRPSLIPTIPTPEPLPDPNPIQNPQSIIPNPQSTPEPEPKPESTPEHTPKPAPLPAPDPINNTKSPVPSPQSSPPTPAPEAASE